MLAAWLVFFLYTTGAGRDGSAAAAARTLGLLVVLGVGGIIYAVVGRVRRVELEGDTFVVHASGGPVRIPAAEVQSVGGSRFTNPERVWLELARPGPLGARIDFLPPQRWLKLFSVHPLVAELNALVERHAGPGRAPLEPSRTWPLALRIGGAVAALALFAGGITLFVVETVRSSEPYQHAVEVTRASGDARAALGEPIEPGWWTWGQLSSTSAGDVADLRIPVAGARAEGTVHVLAHRPGDAWRYHAIELRAAGGTIDLLPGGAATGGE